MSRNLLIVFALWAAIYLPSLGSLEIKGEEGRRILPAVTMLETGNWIVPQIGSQPYLRKPPLVNWLVATSFKSFSMRNEWTARLPSAFCVLAVAMAFITVARSSLGGNGSLIAAVVWLTSFGIIEKGRLIEIEALYVSLFGLAIICWLSWWQERRSRWVTWTVPFIFLGLGLLAKGPLHLVFFYAIVIAVLWRGGEIRELFTGAHLVGLAIMLGLFGAWAIPYLHATEGIDVAHIWSRQFSGRLAGEDFKFTSWILNIPRGLAYFLPWVLLFPLARTVEFPAKKQSDVSGALGLGIGVPFLLVNLIPGSLPRYVMPLLVPGAWWIAMVLTAENLRWPRWLGGKEFQSERWVTPIAVVIAAAICIYAVGIVPRLQKRQKVKNVAAQIDAAVPPNASVYAVDPDYQPFLFYVHRKLFYIHHVNDLPAETRFFLVRPGNKLAAENAPQFSPRQARPILHIRDYRGWQTILFSVTP